MSKLKKSAYGLLRGSFLVKEDSLKNWRFILFMVALMLLMISSAHSSDKKVMEIAALNKEIRELRAEFVDTRSISMKMRLESTIRRKVGEVGILPSETPPSIIRVTSKKKK